MQNFDETFKKKNELYIYSFKNKNVFFLFFFKDTPSSPFKTKCG